MSEMPTCRHCGGSLQSALSFGKYAKRAKTHGFCSWRCERLYVPVLRQVLCANTSCKKGEGQTRKLFTTFIARASCCCKSCQATHYNRMAGARRETQTRQRNDWRAVPDDLSADVIERRLEALARRRRETRSWLRITDPWQQRAGSELHKSVTMDTYDINAGAML